MLGNLFLLYTDCILGVLLWIYIVKNLQGQVALASLYSLSKLRPRGINNSLEVMHIKQ